MNRICKKGAVFTVFLVLLVCFLAAGCRADKASRSDVISIAINDDIVSLDPSGTKDTLSEMLARCIFSTLYVFDEQMNLVPCLAESEKRISDLEWEFRLRKNVKFHDGSVLTASDVKFSLERAMNVERAEKNLQIISSISVPDAYTVRITTIEPAANLPSLFVRVSTSVMSENALKKADYNLNKPVGSGPFQVLERKTGESIALERFSAYFLKPAQTRYLNFVVDPSEQNRTAGLLNGQFDVVYRVSPNDCDYLKLNSSVQVYESDSTKMELFMFNPSVPPLNDIRVRMAVSYAINKQNLVDNVISGYGKPLNGMIPPPLPGSADFEGFSYDPEKARELLKEAGYPPDFKLSVVTFDELRKKMMEYIKLDLAQVGIKLDYEFFTLSEYLDYISDNRHVASAMSWTSNPDPDSTFAQLYSVKGSITVNQARYSDERVEQLIAEGKKESDVEKRRKIYEEANRIVASSYMVLPLYQPSMLSAASKEIGGIRLNSQGLFGFESLFRIKK